MVWFGRGVLMSECEFEAFRWQGAEESGADLHLT